MSFKEQQRERVPCPECGKDLAKGSLVNHRQTQHGVAKGGLGSEGGSTDKVNGVDEPRTYRMAFTEWVEPRPCPVKGCSGQASTRTAMKVHFWHRHVRDTVEILEGGNLSHPRCPLCDILVPWKALNETHRHTSQCNWGAETKRQCLAVEEGGRPPPGLLAPMGAPWRW